MLEGTQVRVEPAATLVGDLAVPGVKGICQRGVLLGAVADGESELRGFGHAADTDAAIEVARALGAEVDEPSGHVVTKPSASETARGTRASARFLRSKASSASILPAVAK